MLPTVALVFDIALAAPTGLAPHAAAWALTPPALRAAAARRSAVPLGSYDLLRRIHASTRLAPRIRDAAVAPDAPAPPPRCDRGAVLPAPGCTPAGTGSVASLVFYAGGSSLDLTLPVAARGNGSVGRNTVYRALTYFHLAGMIAAPLFAVLSRFPEVVGGARDAATTFRSFHLGVGALTAASFTTAVIMEL